MQRIHLIISGDVVGVGYRSWARRLAQGLRLTGWVKNREDRSVELMAEGNKEHLDTLIADCRKGPDVSWVQHVDITWQKATGEFMDFEVVY